MDRSRDLGREHEFFGLMPMLAVADVGATTAYFCDVLGFEVDFVVGEPPVHARIMTGGGIYIHLMEVDEADPEPSGELRIYVGRDLDGLFEEYQARNVDVVFPPKSQPWGLREFAVRAISGHVLRYGSEIIESSAD